MSEGRGARDEGRGAAADRLDSAFSDLVSELQHIANTHVNAVEDRRDELKRVIEMANDRIRKVTALMSDMEILERRLREHAAAVRDTVIEDEAALQARKDDADERDARRDLVRHAPLAEPRPGREDREEAARRRQALAEEIESLLAAGHLPADIAAHLHLQRNEVDMMIRTMERSHRGAAARAARIRPEENSPGERH